MRRVVVIERSFPRLEAFRQIKCNGLTGCCIPTGPSVLDIVEKGPCIILRQMPADLTLGDIAVKKARIFGALFLQTDVMIPVQNGISGASLLRNIGRIIDIALPFIALF